MGGGASKKEQGVISSSARKQSKKMSPQDVVVEQKSAEGKQESAEPVAIIAPGAAGGNKQDTELKRFRDKKKGFTGFRAISTSGSGNEAGGVSGTSLQLGAEGKKSEADAEIASTHLSEFPLFENTLMEDIFEGMSEAKLKGGDVIIKEGQVFPYFVLLIEGELQNGDERVVFANQEALIEPRQAEKELKATTDSRIWVISRLQYQKVTVAALKRKLEKGGSLLETITEIPGLKELPRDTREAIAAALKPITFSKGEYLMRQGEQGHTMYFIEEGEVIIKQNGVNKDEAGEDGVVARRTRGEYIGEGALLDEGDFGQKFGVRNASAIADSDTVRCLALGRNEFQEYMGSLRELFEHNLCCRVLKSLDLTKDLDDAQLSMIVSTLEEGEYKPGEHVVHQGELGDMFYIVKEGTLECTLQEDGKDETKRVGTLIAGDYFGEGALLTNAPRRCNVIAVGQTKTKVWGLKRSNFENILSDQLKEKLGATFQHRKTAKEPSTLKKIEWTDLQKIRTLGSGSYGTVDLVRQKITGETYALKRIRKATVVAKKQQRFVKNERELLSVTSSPFIVNLICTYNKGDSVYMLTEVCLGGELYSLMKETVDQRNHVVDDDEVICGCFELASQCRFYTACIVLAITYLHSKGIIHRDIKPENLLLDENGYLKLADFGFAKMIHDQRTYSLCGTPEYTAPEVYKRSGHSKGVDWWSLGVILYEMASGFSPFHVVSQNSWDCYIEISKYEKFFPNIQFPGLFDDELCDLLLKLMHPNPAKRYGTRKANGNHVKQHPFFGKTSAYPFALDWTKIEARTFVLDEKYRCKQITSGLDAQNFEEVNDRHEEDDKYVDESMMENGGTWYNEF